MKNLSIVLNVVLLIAVAVLYILYFSNKSDISSGNTQSVAVGEGGDVRIAYVNSDTLLKNYQYFKDLSDRLDAKRQKLEKELQNRAQGLQNEIANFQRTAQSMTMNQARAVEEDLMKRQQNLYAYQDNLRQQLVQEEAVLNDSLYTRVSDFLKEYGKENNLEVVLTYTRGSGVLFAHDNLNITSDVLNGLNEQYKKEPKAAAKADTTAKK